ncbi:MAG TPA: sigma-70 family RNA polymerase sigma factor [Chloroflexota bacterium]|nr:sigma-70 family RNA polymerase sigma factor [Chloroflexota bacterium]
MYVRTTAVTGTVGEEQSDEDLVARLRERDAGAFAALYDRYSRMAFGLAYRMLNDPTAAEDVAQEAFLSVWRQAETFHPERSAARTWILSIVHHRAVDRLRRGATTQEVSDASLEYAPDRVDESIDVEHEVSALMEANEIHRALGLLPLEQRRAIEMAYFGGLSHSEIAGKLRIPVGTVKGRLRIGLQKMRVLLDKAGLQGAVHDA